MIDDDGNWVPYSAITTLTAERDELGEQIERMEYSDGDAEHWRHLAARMEAQLKAAREALSVEVFETCVAEQTEDFQMVQGPGGGWLFRCPEWLNISAILSALNPKAPS